MLLCVTGRDGLHARSNCVQMSYEIPLAEAFIDELIPFWAAIFGEALPDIERAVFLGSEVAYSQSTLYVQQEGDQVAGTCFIMHAKTMPALAGFGEVATGLQFRGRGIATDLCRQAVADFRRSAGLPPPGLAQTGRCQCHGQPHHRGFARRVSGRLFPPTRPGRREHGRPGDTRADDSADRNPP